MDTDASSSMAVGHTENRPLALLCSRLQLRIDQSLVLVRGQPVPKPAQGEAKPGEPVSVRLDVQVTDKVLSIGLIVEGQAGEKYVGGAMKKDEWLAAPTFKVVDEAGKLIGSGQFEYG